VEKKKEKKDYNNVLHLSCVLMLLVSCIFLLCMS
jgi:hypothetical protein